jgi:RNA polymerase sigma-70 factor (ECF subfamily)
LLNPATEFDKLYESEFLALVKKIYGITENPEIAKDIAQQAFLQAFQAKDRYVPTSPPEAWLYSIARNLNYTRVRHEQVKQKYLPDLYKVSETSFDDFENKAIIKKALCVLTRNEREVIILSFFYGYSGKQIKIIVNVPYGTINSRKSRALSKMRKFLKGYTLTG